MTLDTDELRRVCAEILEHAKIVNTDCEEADMARVLAAAIPQLLDENQRLRFVVSELKGYEAENENLSKELQKLRERNEKLEALRKARGGCEVITEETLKFMEQNVEQVDDKNVFALIAEVRKLQRVAEAAKAYREEVVIRSGIHFGKSKYCRLSLELEDALKALVFWCDHCGSGNDENPPDHTMDCETRSDPL